MHDGQSPFECRVCKKKFTREDNLVAHYKAIHDHVKPYSCDRCEKKFSTGVHLDRIRTMSMTDLNSMSVPSVVNDLRGRIT